MMGLGAALGIGGALLGGIAGASAGANQTTTRRELAPASELETRSGAISLDSLNQLQQMVNAGPGQSEIAGGVSAQKDLAELLRQLMGTGGLPSQADTQAANTYAGQAFAGQQNSLNNAFADQRVMASRAQARTGRGSFDPIMQNKLAQEQTRQQGQLAADQGSFAAQFAQQLGGQKLNYAQQFAGVQSGLASQAMANRQALLGLGQQLRSGEQNFRAGTATTTQTGPQQGGGFAGFLTGALSGASTGMTAGNAFSGLGGGGSTGTTNANAFATSNSGRKMITG